jgi:hypothetical protein
MVLKAVYNTHSHWIYGLCPSSIIVNNYKTTLWKMDLCQSSGKGRDTPTVLGPSERANLSHLTTHVKSHCNLQSLYLGIKPHFGLVTRYLLLFDKCSSVLVGCHV